MSQINRHCGFQPNNIIFFIFGYNASNVKSLFTIYTDFRSGGLCHHMKVRYNPSLLTEEEATALARFPVEHVVGCDQDN